MPSYEPSQVIENVEALRQLYGDPSPRALTKELDHLNAHYQLYVQAAPFVVVASAGTNGVDVSPRGDAPGFVRVADERTLMLPDRRGNNRADTLLNIVANPQLSLLFMIPGVGETLRVSGRAQIVIDTDLCQSFAVNEKPPRSVLVVHVERAYFQCQKAFARSGLWQDNTTPERGTAKGQVPTAGQMIEAIDATFDGAAYDKNYPQHIQKTIY